MEARVAGQRFDDGGLPVRVCNRILHTEESKQPHTLPNGLGGNVLCSLVLGWGRWVNGGERTRVYVSGRGV